MTVSKLRLDTALTKNRTEELDQDVWQNFVVPPFYDRLDLQEAMKPRVIIGGRGTGKTMLLRYVCHYTTFSPRRKEIPPEDLSHVGLYLRADTQFANAMVERGVPIDVWDAAFQHLLALLLGSELIKSLNSIAESSCPGVDPEQISSLKFESLKAFDPAFATSPKPLLAVLKEREYEFEMWVSNVRKRNEPMFLPGRKFLLAVVDEMRTKISALKGTVYRVYLDECENLALYQQKIINTYLKHSEAPLIFNLAMKRNAFQTRETVGNESITNIPDYREYDIEDWLSEDFDVFAAEILFMNLALAGLAEVPISIAKLRDLGALETRREKGYRQSVTSAAAAMFPGRTQEQLAADVFSDPPVANQLLRSIKDALSERGSELSPSVFFRPDLAMASIITPALLRRPNVQPEQIAADLDAFAKGGDNGDNRFSGKTNWIKNYFVGCLLQLYEPHSRVAPFYAGFDTFVLMAHDNVRHFLELCNFSLSRAPRMQPRSGLIISVRDQAEAAREASSAILGEIRSFGRFGTRLHTFALRLGSVFAMAHRRPTQSEPEINHFSVTRGIGSISEADFRILNEAVKWSVLFEEAETKVKNE